MIHRIFQDYLNFYFKKIIVAIDISQEQIFLLNSKIVPYR